MSRPAVPASLRHAIARAVARGELRRRRASSTKCRNMHRAAAVETHRELDDLAFAAEGLARKGGVA